MTTDQLTRDFNASEFVCKHCGKHGIKFALVEALQGLRDALGGPVQITSGYRCEKHPVEAKKQKPGRHTLGIAADIAGHPLKKIWHTLADFPEFVGIGVAPHQGFIHVDMRQCVKPGGRVIWAYDRDGNQVKWSGKWEELP